MERYKTLERFLSKRNDVYLVAANINGVEQKLVLKEHRSPVAARREQVNLRCLYAAGVPVPRVLHRRGAVLYLEFLEGLLLADIVERDLIAVGTWAPALAYWYFKLHQVARRQRGVLLKSDNSLRNFIFKGGIFYGLDFEERRWGNPARDLGQVCAFILADRPAFDQKKFTFIDRFVDQYCLLKPAVQREQVELELVAGLKLLADRRPEESREIYRFLERYH